MHPVTFTGDVARKQGGRQLQRLQKLIAPCTPFFFSYMKDMICYV